MHIRPINQDAKTEPKPRLPYKKPELIDFDFGEHTKGKSLSLPIETSQNIYAPS